LLRILAEDGQIVLKTVPIDEAERISTVSLTSALGSRDVRRTKLDGPGLIEAFAELRRQLADWLDNDSVKEMQIEKERLLKATTEPDFWDNGERARDSLARFYFLDRLLRRLRQLAEKAEYLEDFAVLVNRERDTRYQAELAADYEEFYQSVSYLNIELMTAHLPHRNQAMMLITALGMPSVPENPHDAWIRQISELYLHWAERKGYDHDLYLLVPDEKAPAGGRFVKLTAGNFREMLKKYARHEPTEEIAIFYQGTNVFGFLKGERGVHKLAGKDATSEEHARVQVFAIPDGTDIGKWFADYQRIKDEIATGKRQPPPAQKHTVIRTYALDRSDRYIRDMRTGVRLPNVKDVMEKGLIDEFILAYLQTEERSVAWEDRFPQTFPF